MGTEAGPRRQGVGAGPVCFHTGFPLYFWPRVSGGTAQLLVGTGHMPGFLGAGGFLFGRWGEPGGTCRAWEIASGTEKHRPQEHQAAWSPPHRGGSAPLFTHVPPALLPTTPSAQGLGFQTWLSEDRGAPCLVSHGEYTDRTSSGWGRRAWLGEAGRDQRGFGPQHGSWGVCPLTRPPGFSFPQGKSRQLDLMSSSLPPAPKWEGTAGPGRGGFPTNTHE